MAIIQSVDVVNILQHENIMHDEIDMNMVV